jgi:hypothetical protein
LSDLPQPEQASEANNTATEKSMAFNGDFLVGVSNLPDEIENERPAGAETCSAPAGIDQ